MKPIANVSLSRMLILGVVVSAALLAGPLQASAEVGVAAAVNVDARGRPPGAVPRVISLGSNIVFNEEIATDGAGLVQVLLLDGTTFTVGPNSQLTIDEFVYNPNTGEAKVVASLSKGVFRFVGARTSQTEGGAIVKTPVGTIGIRGAVTNISCDDDGCKAALVAGKSLTIVDSDGTQRIVYETGYTAVITKDPGGGTTTTVRKSTAAETRVFQQQLAGKSGQNGGTSNPPTDKTVEDSQFAGVNSGLPNIMDVPGSPKPVQSTEPSRVEQAAGIDGKTQDELDNYIEEQNNNPPPPPPLANARLLTAPSDGYVVDPVNGGDPQNPTPNPGDRGLVGSTDDGDRGVLLTVQGDRLTTGDGTLDLPDYSGVEEGEGDPPEALYPAVDRISIGNSIEDEQASYLGSALAGYAYAGRGDFVAYLLGINGDRTQPVYVIYGTPTTPEQLQQFTDNNVKIREYALTPDPISPIEELGIPVVPFFRDDAYGEVNALYYNGEEYLLALSSTNLFLVEDGGGDVKQYQSWIHISGEGADQKSAAFLYTAGMFEDEDGNIQMGGARRGTFRTDAYEGPVNMRGGINTIAGATGEHFFGRNADNFVIGSSLDPADGYTDAPLRFDEVFTGNPADGYLGDGSPFTTTHVAGLVGETPITEYGQPGQPTRTTRDVTGFISGMGEAFVGDPVYDKEAPYILASNAPNFMLSLDAETNRVSAQAEVFDVLVQNDVVESLLIRFGPHEDTYGGNAFVDDNIFGTQKNNDAENTRLRTDEGGDLAHAGSFSPGSYLISGRANPIDGYQHLEGCEECAFIDWGWWGTRVETDANVAAGVPNDRRDYVHMGTWVAGDITDPQGLPNITASYEGTALGTVSRDSGEGIATYIARGDLDMSVNLSTRSGHLAITNFDSMNVYAPISDSSSLTQALFSGTLYDTYDYYDGYSNSSANFTGSVSGALVNDGPNVAAGVIGNFGFSDAGVSAVGTIAGIQN